MPKMRQNLYILVMVTAMQMALAQESITPIAASICGVNEEYYTCGVDGTCAEPIPPNRTACYEGCFCSAGYVRDPSYNCILPDSCNAITCGEGEKANICPRYCTFDYDCQSAIGGAVRECVGTEAEYQCQPRCDCIKKLMRVDGVCVEAKFCPADTTCTRPNEVFNDCGTCDPTCATPNPICYYNCTVGCFCAPGYRRDDSTYTCVLPENCPNTTACYGQNEVFTYCGSCDGTCDNQNPICAAVCTTGCFCAAGYVRDTYGQCIAVESCASTGSSTGNEPQTVNSPSVGTTSVKPTHDKSSKTCTGKNEVYNTCGGCDGTCDNPNPFCTKMCHVGCFCIADHVRNKDGKCIRLSDCNAPKPKKRKRKCKKKSKKCKCKKCKSRRHRKRRIPKKISFSSYDDEIENLLKSYIPRRSKYGTCN